MPNDSSTGGYLVPLSTEGQFGTTYEDFLQSVFAGISGLTGSLVRPRWQSKPPPLPTADVSWLAFGVTRSTPDTNAYLQHNPAGEGSHLLERHETSEVLLSAYGPTCDEILYRVRDGLDIRQNRDAMRSVGIAFRECSGFTRLADLRGTEWIGRVDMTLYFRRVIRRIYPILNLRSVHGSFVFDDGSSPQTFNVEQ